MREVGEAVRVPAAPGARADSLQSAASQTWGKQTRKEKLKPDLRAREVPILTCPFLCPFPVFSTASNRCGKRPWAVSWLEDLKSGEGAAAGGQCVESQRAAGKPRDRPTTSTQGYGTHLGYHNPLELWVGGIAGVGRGPPPGAKAV